MRKTILMILALMLMLGGIPLAHAQPSPALPPERLVSLTHNAPNTGIMLPAAFDPYEDTYLLTIASWVSRITFTPVTSSPAAVVTVNGQVVQSGQKSQIIQLTDKPQEVLITVSAYNGAQLTGQTTYTVFLQRRPSERRTRVSAGFISNIVMKGSTATISADLVTLSYTPNTNITTFINDTVYMYTYDCDPSCLFYFGTLANPVRANTAQAFINNYLSSGSNLYYLIYIEDKIVAVLPYAPG